MLNYILVTLHAWRGPHRHTLCKPNAKTRKIPPVTPWRSCIFRVLSRIY